MARSATPRFAFRERLGADGGLPKTLPITEWVERLERLEVKVAGETKTWLCARSSARAAPPSPIPAAPPQPKTQDVDDGERSILGKVRRLVGKEKAIIALSRICDRSGVATRSIKIWHSRAIPSCVLAGR